MQKGIFLHTTSKIAVILSAYILHFFLGKMLTVEEYGVMGMIIHLTNFYYLFLTNGVRQSISKDISVQLYEPKKVVSSYLVIQMTLGIGLGVLNYFLAPVIADVFGNPNLQGYFEVVSVLIPLTALYFALTGALNGMKIFLCEAIVMIIYPLGRLSAVPFVGMLQTDKPMGVVWGLVLGSLVAAIFAMIFVSRHIGKAQKPEKPQKLKTRHLLDSAAHFIALFAGVTVILNLDTFMLMFLKGNETLTGYYTAVCNFSLVPYYLVSAIYLVILPFVTRAFKDGDMKGVAKIISKNLNFIIVGVLPIVALICTSSYTLLNNFYNEQYVVAAPTLALLSAGIFLLSVFVVFTVSLNGMNKQRKTMTATFILLGIDFALQFLLVPKYDIFGAATATTVTSVIGVVWAYIALRKEVGHSLFTRGMIKGVIMAAIFSAVSYFVFNYVTFTSLLTLIVAYVIIWGAFMLIMIKAKIIHKKELLAFFSPSKAHKAEDTEAVEEDAPSDDTPMQ